MRNASQLPTPLPISTMPMDDEAASLMWRWYGHEWHRVRFGVDADPISIQRRDQRRRAERPKGVKTH
jgi:hypothetical protein